MYNNFCFIYIKVTQLLKNIINLNISNSYTILNMNEVKMI